MNFFILIIIQQIGHETIHKTLFNFEKLRTKGLNEFFGVFVFSLIGHNYFLMRDSHFKHHKFGRYPDARYLVEWRYKEYTFRKKVEYYALLFGAGYIFNVIGGFAMWLGNKHREHFYAENSTKKLNLIVAQCIVLIIHTYIIYSINNILVYLSTYLLLAIYWGVSQNLPHYGITISKEKKYRYAARSYNVNEAIHFLMFGTMFSHLQHHVFPNIPGIFLNESNVDKEVNSKLGISLYRKRWIDYFFDMANQFKGPQPKFVEDWRMS